MNCWIERDPTVEMRVTLRLLASSKAINSGPPLLLTTAFLLRLLKSIHIGEVCSLRPTRLVISSSKSSSSSSSFSSSSSSSSGSSTTEPLSVGTIQTLPPMEDSVRADDPDGATDRSDPLEESSHSSRFVWVDPKVIEFIFVYRDLSSIDSFMDRHHLLKSDASYGILAIDYCHPTDTICMGWLSYDGPFLFVYSCLFLDLHVALPFDDFTMGVLRAFNVAPCNFTQTHGPPSKPFGSCEICFVFVPFLPPFSTTIRHNHPTRLTNCPLSTDRVPYSSPPSPPHTKILRQIFSRFLLSPG